MLFLFYIVGIYKCSLVETVADLITNEMQYYSTKYVGVIDAGTTGTRLNIYGFIMPGEILSYYNVSKITPGLHTLKTQQKVKESIKKLLDIAKKKIQNKVDLKNIPIAFYGTAGFRSLDEKDSYEKLMSIIELLDTYNNQNNSVDILSPYTEGLYALDAIKFLKDYNDLILHRYGCKNKKTKLMLKKINSTFCKLKTQESDTKYVGIMEMGGGSIQIAYEFNKNDTYNDPAHVIETETKKIYLNAFPGWGLVEGMNTLDKNKEYELNLDDKKITMRDELIRDFKADNKPNINFTNEIYLLAFFYEKYTKLGCKFKTTYGEIQSKTKQKCDRKNTKFCEEIRYINMFIDAQGFDKDKTLYLVKDIASINASWAIRQALNML